MNFVEIERCYSGFMGHQHVAFIWSGKELLGYLFLDNNDKWHLRSLDKKKNVKS